MATKKRSVSAKRIVPIREAGQSRTGTLHMTYDQICELVGPPNCTDDPTKVEASWGFAAASDPDQKGFVWCYKQAANECTSWSVDGDPDLLLEVFGGAVVTDRDPLAATLCTRHEDCRQSPALARACLAGEPKPKPKKPKPKREAKHHVKFMLTAAELRALKAICEESGLMVGDALRTMIRHEHANVRAARLARGQAVDKVKEGA